jgi:hypothetical protein
MISMRNEDEDADMDKTNTDGYGQEQGTDRDIQSVCMETNESTTEQNKETSKTMAMVNALPKDATVGDVGKRVEKPVRDRGKGTATVHSGGGGTITSPQT